MKKTLLKKKSNKSFASKRTQCIYPEAEMSKISSPFNFHDLFYLFSPLADTHFLVCQLQEFGVW